MGSRKNSKTPLAFWKGSQNTITWILYDDFFSEKNKKKKISTGIIRFSQQIYIAFRLCENQVANKSTSPLESRCYSPLKLSEVQEMQIFWLLQPKGEHRATSTLNFSTSRFPSLWASIPLFWAASSPRRSSCVSSVTLIFQFWSEAKVPFFSCRKFVRKRWNPCCRSRSCVLSPQWCFTVRKHPAELYIGVKDDGVQLKKKMQSKPLQNGKNLKKPRVSQKLRE